ncbi:MAG: hypothetical protein ACQKBU_10565 [Verrucomicrobiales bacterium]
MEPHISPTTLNQLRERLHTAESLATTALGGAKEENPLYEPTRRLLAVHQDLRKLLEPQEEDSPEDKVSEFDRTQEVTHAAIEIEREEHTLKADALDILKALFMWKDDPVERAKETKVRMAG